jgi:hypothetical protein
MPSVSITCGMLLILIGVVGYAYGMTSGHASITALIPAAFGIVLLILGFVAKSSDGLRKHLMHAAVIVGLIGFLIPAWRLLSKISEITMSAAFLSQLSMALVCLVFVILAVRSFIEARRNREAQA